MADKDDSSTPAKTMLAGVQTVSHTNVTMPSVKEDLKASEDEGAGALASQAPDSVDVPLGVTGPVTVPVDAAALSKAVSQETPTDTVKAGASQVTPQPTSANAMPTAPAGHVVGKSFPKAQAAASHVEQGKAPENMSADRNAAMQDVDVDEPGPTEAPKPQSPVATPQAPSRSARVEAGSTAAAAMLQQAIAQASGKSAPAPATAPHQAAEAAVVTENAAAKPAALASTATERVKATVKAAGNAATGLLVSTLDQAASGIQHGATVVTGVANRTGDELMRHEGGEPTFAAYAATVDRPSAPDLGPQIIKGLQLQLTAGGGDMKLTLTPEHLGEVTIQVKVSGEHVTATLASEKPEVRQWIANHQDDLRRGLTGLGLTLDEVVVKDEVRKDEQRQPAHDRPRRQPRERDADEKAFEVVV